MSMSTDIDAPTGEAEIEAIKQVIATVEHAQNNELPDEFLSLFRADAIWTTGGGKRLYTPGGVAPAARAAAAITAAVNPRNSRVTTGAGARS